MIIFFKLLLGHAIADFPLQSEFIAKFKNYHNVSPAPVGQVQATIWPYVLSAHAATHAAAVWLVTGNQWLALAEFVAHWLIDLAKCANRTGIHQDQGLHIACKILWSVFA